MVDATVSFAIQKLSDFLTKEVNIRIGVRDGVRWLKDEMGYLQALVRDAEAKQVIDPLTRQWMNNVKDVANEALIILDRFSAVQEESAAPKQGCLGALQRCICICKKEANLHDIGEEIDSLKGRVVEIKNRRDEYNIPNILATSEMQKRKRTLLRATSFENEVDVVGFQDDVKILLAQLVGEDPSLRVISIHGMGGLGKTTVASKLYHSSELSHFRSRAWVCVSQDYNIKDVLKTIIKSLTGKEMDLLLLGMEEVDLLQHLRKLLVGRHRYLAVIDDIWDIEAWEKIKKAFPDKNNGSRVIITTRNKKVAARVDDRCFVHQLRLLSEDESWQLFCKRTKPTPNLEKLGKEMVDKCGGLPLAIVVLSGLLLHKKSYEDWSEVKEHIWRHLKYDSVEIQEILILCYNDLPFQMGKCFLYLARFQEDRMFEVTKLMHLWIAEEFISEGDEEDGVLMEDVAKDYLNELINRNMIQIAKLDLSGRVSCCKVHDLIRDLAVAKAKEEKLLGVFDLSKKHPNPIHMLQGQPRHAIYDGIGKYLELLGPSSDDLKLRSFAVTLDCGVIDMQIMEVKNIRLMYTRFKLLKVLDLNSVRSEGIPEEIGDLVLLKFFGLISPIGFQPLVIPGTIGKLKKLQTLRGTGALPSTYIFPREICELKELRHLICFYCASLNMGSHKRKLQTLWNISYDGWIRIDTVNLRNLYSLGIIVAEDSPHCNLDSIANLTSLQTFSFAVHSKETAFPTIKPLSSCKSLRKVILDGGMTDESDVCYLPDSVTFLRLVRSEFAQDPMPILGSLSNLTALWLANMKPVGNKLVFGHGEFPSLRYVKLSSLSTLEELRVEDRALPSLKGLSINECDQLKKIPQPLNSLPPIPDIYDPMYDSEVQHNLWANLWN